MYRRAEQKDLARLTELFVASFGDSPEFARMALEDFTGIQNVFVAEQGASIVASLCAVPVTLQDKKGAYFYAVCSDEKWRGQGIMTGLMKAVQDRLAKEGAQFVTLIPASGGLFDFYAQRGFQNAFAKRKIERTIRNNLWAVAEFDTITANGFENIRKKYAPNSVMLSSCAWRCVITNLYSGGLTTVSTEDGYGLYFKKADKLRFIELFANSDKAAEYILEAARQKDGVEKAEILLGENQNLFLGEGTLQDYGMIRFLGAGFDVRECYMRLMLDD